MKLDCALRQTFRAHDSNSQIGRVLESRTASTSGAAHVSQGFAQRYPASSSSARPHILVAAASIMDEGAYERDGVVPMGYAAYDLEEQLRQDLVQSLEEYAALQASLLKRTQRAGTFLAGYLLLTVSSQAALATLIGTAASYGYLRWLIHDMAGLSRSTVQPFQEARRQQGQPLRAVVLALAAYRQAIKPRLVIPVGLAAGMAAYNNVSQEPLHGMEQAALLAGFLSYKAALLLTLWDDTKPRLEPAGQRRPQRPDLAVLPEVEELAREKELAYAKEVAREKLRADA